MNSTLTFLQGAKNRMTEHPYQTALHVGNAVVLCMPAAATVPFFSALGFTSAGPTAGSAASSIMSYFSFVPASGIYATVQSAAMSGYGASVAAGAAQAGAVASSATAWVLGWKVGNATQP